MAFLKKIYDSLFKPKQKEEIPVVNMDIKEEFVESVSSVKIILDAGHGYDTVGKRSPYSATGIEPAIEYYEYKWNREIVEKIAIKLSEKGYDVEILVPEDNDISLSERVRRVNEICDRLGKENVILVSVHANAMGNGTKWEKAVGWEAYTSVGTTKSDRLADIFYKNAQEMFPDKKIRTDWSDGDIDKEAGFYIIKKSKCVAILTENFFYDNINEVQFILSGEGREKIVRLHVDSIIEYLK